MYRIALRGFVCTFFLLIALPFVQTIVPIVPTPAVDEHRPRISRPDFARLQREPKVTLADVLYPWFDDRVGFRDALIRVKTQIDYYVFDVSRKVYLGREGWLFQRISTDLRVAVERWSEEDYRAVERSFLQLADVLRKRGIRLVVVGYPDKSAFYPAYLPSDAPRLPASGNVERLRRFLAGAASFEYLDVEQILRARESTDPLFYKTDLHVNLLGQLPVVAEIIERIARLEQRPDIRFREEFTLTSYPWTQGAEARFLPLLKPVEEQIVSAPDLFEVGKVSPHGRWVTNDPRRVDYPGIGSFPIFDWEFIANPGECKARLPGAMLFGNSFSNLYWSLGIQNYFCRLRRARTVGGYVSSSGRLTQFVNDIPAGTKYFIFQFLYPFLPFEAPKLDGI